MNKDKAEKEYPAVEEGETAKAGPSDSDRVAEVVEALAESGAQGMENLLSGEESELVRQELSQHKNEIREILEGNRERISTDLIDGVLRNVEFSKKVDSLLTSESGAAENETDRRQLAGVVERHQWGKIFTKLETGDRVLSFLVPGADFLAIKNLNNPDIFGELNTNKIIARKRIVVGERVAAKFPDALSLANDYKTDVFKIPVGIDLDPAMLEDLAREVDVEMAKFINELGNELLTLKTSEAEKLKLQDFLDKLNGAEDGSSKSGFRMNYGLATVEGDKTDEKLGAFSQALQTSSMARGGEKYGETYESEKVLVELDFIESLRNEIQAAGNTITDSHGNEFKVFSQEKDEHGEYFAINMDLLRDVRKDKFEAADTDKDQDVLKKLTLYINKTNIFDVIKPFVYSQVEAVSKRAVDNKELAKKIATGEKLTAKEIKEATEIFYADERAPQFTSRMEFDRTAISIKNAAYVNLDVKDLGVRLKMEFERKLQIVNQKTNPEERLRLFNELTLSAGDETTKLLSDFWQSVAKISEEFGVVRKDGLINGRVGGDELNLVVEIGEGEGKLSRKRMTEFLFVLKNRTNSRVIETNSRLIETVVSESEKDVSDETDDNNLAEAHLSALKRAEKGGSVLKDIEEAARKLTRALNTQNGLSREVIQNKIDGLDGIFVIEGDSVIANVVVMEKDNDLVVVNDKNIPFNYNNIKQSLDRLLN